MKKTTAFLLALAAAFRFGATVLAGVWDKEDLLAYAVYCKTHSYEEQMKKYHETFQSENGASDKFFSEEEFRQIQNGENALIVIHYELSEEVYSWVGEPEYNLRFPILMNDGREINPSDRSEAACLHRLTDRNVFTVKEHLLEGGIENETDRIVFAGMSAADPFICGYVFKGYTFLPCKNGWNEIDGNRYYIKSDGTVLTKSAVIDGIRYKFDESGICQGKYTGYTKSSKGKRYWKNGELVKNKWIRVKGVRKYYAGSDGYFVTGMREINGKEYSFDENGALKK